MKTPFQMRCACLLLGLALMSGQSMAQSDLLRRGQPLPISTGVAPTLILVEVHRVESTGLIDVAVVLDAPRQVGGDLTYELLEFGELCLRYGTEFLGAAVPPVEHSRLRVIAFLYRGAIPGLTDQEMDRGFAFKIENSRCTVAPPFPETLQAEATRRAGSNL